MGAILSSHRADRPGEVMGWGRRRPGFSNIIRGEDIQGHRKVSDSPNIFS